MLVNFPTANLSALPTGLHAHYHQQYYWSHCYACELPACQPVCLAYWATRPQSSAVLLIALLCLRTSRLPTCLPCLLGNTPTIISSIIDRIVMLVNFPPANLSALPTGQHAHNHQQYYWSHCYACELPACQPVCLAYWATRPQSSAVLLIALLCLWTSRLPTCLPCLLGNTPTIISSIIDRIVMLVNFPPANLSALPTGQHAHSHQQYYWSHCYACELPACQPVCLAYWATRPLPSAVLLIALLCLWTSRLPTCLPCLLGNTPTIISSIIDRIVMHVNFPPANLSALPTGQHAHNHQHDYWSHCFGCELPACQPVCLATWPTRPLSSAVLLIALLCLWTSRLPTCFPCHLANTPTIISSIINRIVMLVNFPPVNLSALPTGQHAHYHQQ